MQNTYFFQRRRLIRLAAAIALAALAGIALFGGIAAQEDTRAILRSDPPAVSLAQGQTITVSFTVENISELYGADVRASFDAGALEAVDADPSAPDVQIAPGKFLKPDFVVRSVADNAAGTIWYAATQVSPTLPASGTGLLFTAALRAKTDVAAAPITLTYVKLVNRDGRELAITVVSGTVSAPATAAPAASAPATAAVPTGETAISPTAAVTGNAAAPESPTASAASQPPLCAAPGLLMLPLGAISVGVATWASIRKAGRG